VLLSFPHPPLWFAHAPPAAEHLTDSAMALRASGAEPGQSVLLLLNVGDEPVEFAVDTTGLTVAEVPDPAAIPADPRTVAPHSWTILA
jgi:hypothetical protein